MLYASDTQPFGGGIAFVVASFRRRQGTRAARPGSFITSFPMVAFGRNIATGKELKSFGGGIWKQYCHRRGTVPSAKSIWSPLAILRPRLRGPFGAGQPFSQFPLAQVYGAFGAGRQVVWCRCDIWVWTCATPGRRVVFCGAGHHSFSTPAPIRTHTCAKKSIHLRQLASTPAPKAWACRSVNGTSRTLQDWLHLYRKA